MAEPYFQGMQPPLLRGMGSLYKKLPTNMRLLAENLFGVDSPITEKDFKPEELELIRDQIDHYKRINKAKESMHRNMLSRAGTPREKESRERWLQTYEDTAGQTAITNPYGGFDVPSEWGVVDQPWAESLYRSFTDPQYNVATSLGKYVAEDVEGGMRVIDEYNFNQQQRNLPSGLAALKRILGSPELAGEYLANALDTPSRNVDINLPDI